MTVFSFLCIALLSLAYASLQPDFIETVSGRQIPTHVLQSRFKTVNIEEASSKLYEIKEDRYLHGEDRIVDLHAIATTVKPVKTAGNLQATFNGVSTSNAHAEGYLRVGGGYIVSHMQNGEILSVWGAGMSLSPLHHSEHPGVFMNVWKPVAAENVKSVGREEYEAIESEADLLNDAVVRGTNAAIRPSDSEFESLATLRQQTSCANRNAPRTFELAISMDNVLCASEFDGNMNRAMTGFNNFLAAAEESFSANTCIRLRMRHFDGHCNDPNDPYEIFQGESANGILQQYRILWQGAPYTSIARDYAFLFTGFEESSDTVGNAFQNGACSRQRGFGWVEGFDLAVAVHEIGHALDASHTGQGIMMSDPTQAPNRSFSQTSIDQIVNFMDNGGGSRCMPLDSSSPTNPPAVTRTPTPSPTPRPRTQPPSVTPPTGSCASGFTATKGLKCVTETVTVARTKQGRVSTTVSTQNNQVHVTFTMVSKDKARAGNRKTQFRILEHGIYLTMNNGIRFGRTASSSDGKGVRSITVKRDVSQIANANVRAGCCGRRLNVYQNLLLQRATVDGSGRFIGTPKTEKHGTRFFVTLPCLSCSSPKKLFPMSASRKCPKCE